MKKSMEFATLGMLAAVLGGVAWWLQAVPYTHLDVYKRQMLVILAGVVVITLAKAGKGKRRT